MFANKLMFLCLFFLSASLLAASSDNSNTEVVLSSGAKASTATRTKEWISEIDNKYLQANPDLYAKVRTANYLVSGTNGGRALAERAVNILNEVLKIDPGFAPAYVQLARANTNLGVMNEESLRTQEEYLKKALSLEPDYDYAIAMMGYTKMYQGDLINAGKYYNRAVQLRSRYPFLKSQMAQLEIRRGNYKKAIALAKQGAKDNAGNMSGYRANLGEMSLAYAKLAEVQLFTYSDYEKSIKYGEQAFELNGSIDVRKVLVTAYLVKWAAMKSRNVKNDILENEIDKAVSVGNPTQDMIQRLSENKKLKKAADEIVAEMTRRDIEIYQTINGANGSIIYIKKAE